MERRFLGQADRYLEQYAGRIRDCVGLLSDEQVWWRPNEACNSIGNLMLHLSGNLSQWVLAALGGQPFDRRRAQEFRAREGAPGAELLARLEGVVLSAREVIARLDTAALEKPRHVQGQDLDGLGIVFHVVEHMSYHTGQIVAAAKQLAGPEAGIEFYPQHRDE